MCKFGILHNVYIFKEYDVLKKSSGMPKMRNTESKRYKRAVAEYLNGKYLKCVTERVNGIEEVIGKSGAIIKKDDELIIYSSSEVLMRTKIEYLQAWELLSLDGVVITAPDFENNIEERSIIAYYSYYRELDN